MNCPWCEAKTRVYDTAQPNAEGRGHKLVSIEPYTIVRYRKCPNNHRFTTVESIAEQVWDRIDKEELPDRVDLSKR